MIKALVLLIIIAATVNAQHLPASNANNFNTALNAVKDFSVAEDKQLHAAGCYVISSIVSTIVYNKTNNKKHALLSGLGVSLLIGAGKEMYDIKNGDSNWEDMLANTIGATLGVVTVKIAI
tara:strand:+ start:3746 stop:4108 length:363 start_codon:yes stop_codon:yes gene_type:complete